MTISIDEVKRLNDECDWELTIKAKEIAELAIAQAVEIEEQCLVNARGAERELSLLTEVKRLLETLEVIALYTIPDCIQGVPPRIANDLMVIERLVQQALTNNGGNDEQ